MRSSAKITVFLGPAQDQVDVGEGSTAATSNWTCGVCGYVNAGTPSELGGSGISSTATKCGLCGVAFSSVRAQATSLPPTRPVTPRISAPATPITPTTPSTLQNNSLQIACPACTFLNHRSLSDCEICSTPLPKLSSALASPAPAVASSAPVPAAPPINGEMDIIRLSFRKGGEKDAYRKLKSVLSIRGWESGVRHSHE